MMIKTRSRGAKRVLAVGVLSSAILLGTAAGANASPGYMYPVIANAMTECDLIGLGTQGTCVQTIQETLNQTQGETLVVDSQFGPSTQAAVVRFQLANGLPADGVVGERTKQAIRQAMQDRVNQLDTGEAVAGVGSWEADLLCSVLGPFAPACVVLTN